MKKLLISLFMSLPLMTQSQELQKGYHGFVDVGYCYYISQFNPSTIEVTTSHGCQFNPYLFLGAGVGFDFTGKIRWGEVGGRAYNKRDAKVDIHVFFNARANMTKTKLSPFVDARIGAYVNNDGNIYANFAIGGRYEVASNIGLSFSVGYEIRKLTVQQINMTTPTRYNNYTSEYYYTDRTGQNVDGFVFKMGFDF